MSGWYLRAELESSTFEEILLLQNSWCKIGFYLKYFVIRSLLARKIKGDSWSTVTIDRSQQLPQHFSSTISRISLKLEYKLKPYTCNKQKMAEHRKKYWNDVVRSVQRAGIEEQTRIKAEQRQINRQYKQILDEQIARNRQVKQKRSIQKIQERKFIQEEARLEREKKIIEKREKMKKQLESKEINYELIQQIRASRHTPEKVPQHPFIKLVDHSQQRRAETRKKMMLQNDINLLQTKIKRQQEQQVRSSQKKAKQQYIKYVQNYYDKKLEDRNLFKRKYLKLNNLERSHLYPPANGALEPQDVDYQYRRCITNQIEENNLKKARREELDQMMERINNNVNIPSSSPAFLGRNPANHDRKKQLQYLSRGAYKRVQNFPSQNKIQYTAPIQSRKKGLSYAQEIPQLQQYFSHQLKTKTEHSNTEKSLNTSELKTVPEKAISISHKGYKIRELDPLKGKVRMNTEPNESLKERKKFTTFDIILGRNRQIYI